MSGTWAAGTGKTFVGVRILQLLQNIPAAPTGARPGKPRASPGRCRVDQQAGGPPVFSYATDDSDDDFDSFPGLAGTIPPFAVCALLQP